MLLYSLSHQTSKQIAHSHPFNKKNEKRGNHFTDSTQSSAKYSFVTHIGSAILFLTPLYNIQYLYLYFSQCFKNLIESVHTNTYIHTHTAATRYAINVRSLLKSSDCVVVAVSLILFCTLLFHYYSFRININYK